MAITTEVFKAIAGVVKQADTLNLKQRRQVVLLCGKLFHQRNTRFKFKLFAEAVGDVGNVKALEAEHILQRDD